MRRYHVQSCGKDIKNFADHLSIDEDGLKFILQNRIIAIFKNWDFCVELPEDWESQNQRNDK